MWPFAIAVFYLIWTPGSVQGGLFTKHGSSVNDQNSVTVKSGSKLRSAIIYGNIPRLGAQSITASFDSLFCPICRSSLKTVLPFINYRWGVNALIWSLNKLCIKARMFDDYICKGTINLFKDEFVQVVRKLRPDTRSICHILVDECYPDFDIFGMHEWENIALPPKTLNNSYTFPVGERNTLKVLHLTDLHIDLDYMQNADAQCGQPLCCRRHSNGVANATKSYYWGTRYSCDIPFRTFEAVLREAKRRLPNPDIIFWTGDAPAHDIWAYSQKKTDFFLRNITDYLVNYFPNTTILPAIGNHEGVPVNQFRTQNNWLYSQLEEQWGKFRLSPQSYETIKRHGYYTELLRPGFRVIAINSNFCNNANFWILTASGDPGNQQNWLVNTLLEAEEKSEKVLLLGHIPPGEIDQVKFCSNFFYEIINRFENTVRAQFYGHTHWDHFKLFYRDEGKKVASNVAYVTPSVTTWIGMDPSFRIFELDHWNNKDSTFAVLDHHTFTANVHIPIGQNLVWKKEYSARNEYKLKDLSPQSWSSLVNSWDRNENADLFNKYYMNKYHHNLKDSCVGDCKNQVLCIIKGASRNNSDECHG